MYNHSWNQGTPISAETFKNSLRLLDISVNPQEEVTISFNVPQAMFLDHSILVTLSTKFENGVRVDLIG